MIPYGRQNISEADIEAVVQALRSEFLTQGPAVPEFEAAVAEYGGTAYGVAVNSATSALHVACLALGLGPGDWLWTSPNTFVASANCGIYCGAKVDFVDIDPVTRNLSVDALARKLEIAAVLGLLPKIVIPVHFAGQSCDMRGIRILSELYGFRVIEDASHAIGGRYLGVPVGGCQYSDVAVFSFHPVKIITTAEGGMALTGDERLAERMRLLRSHGVTRNQCEFKGPSDGAWYYEQIALGFNYRLTDVQAILGTSQMKRLDEFVSRRRRIAARYDLALAQLPVCLPGHAAGVESAHHLYTIMLRDPKRRRSVFDDLRASGIGVNVHYIPVHLQPFYRSRGFERGQFPNAEAYYDGALSLPIYFGLSDDAQDRVIAALHGYLLD